MMHGAAGQGTKEEIANEIAMKQPSLERIRRRTTSEKPLSASIVSWYESFNEGEVKNQEARDLYRTYQHLLVSARRSGKLSSAFLKRIAQQNFKIDDLDHVADKYILRISKKGIVVL